MKKCCFAVLIILPIILICCGGPDTEGKTYTVRYYGNGNTGGFAPEDNNHYSSGDNAVVKDQNTLTKSGYNFLHWNTRQDDSGVAYNPDDTIPVVNINIHLYAIWGNSP